MAGWETDTKSSADDGNMMQAPFPVATFVGPPDMGNLSGGQRVLEQARQDLANHLDSQIMEHKVVLDNAQAELASNIEYVIANGKVALQNARNSLDRRINLTLGNAMQLASQYGIEPPAPSEIRTRTAYPPPTILQTAPGNSPQPAISGGNPYGGWADGGQSPAESPASNLGCATHLLPETLRESYRKVVETSSRQVLGITFLGDNQYDDAKHLIRIFPNWWTAHLYCKLYHDCKWLAPQRDKYLQAIMAVVLGPKRDLRQSGDVCTIAKLLWPA